VIRTHFNLSVLFVLLVVALPMRAAPPAGVEGEMTEVKGNVSLVRGQAPAVRLRKNDTVQAGDEILTDRKSSAIIRMPDSSTVRIYPNSHVVLRTETGSWKEFLHVLLGTVHVQIEKLSGRPNPKTLTTPTAIIAVRGTIFGVAVEQTGDTRVGVGKGLVSVANQLHPGDEVLVKAGQSVWVRRDQRPTQPQMMREPMPGLSGCNEWDGMDSHGYWDDMHSGSHRSGDIGHMGSHGNTGQTWPHK
jgi:ferric-dicitrate binding protein FerR (iron transport regulator)